VARRSKRLDEDRARAPRPRVIRDFVAREPHRFVESNRTFVSRRGQGFQPFHSGPPASFGELLVQAFADASPAVIGVNPDEMHVPCRGRRWDHDPQEETDQLPVLFRDQGVLAKLVEEHGISAPSGWPSPPLVEHRNDIVVVKLRKTPDSHDLGQRISRTQDERTASPISMSQSADTPQEAKMLFCPFCRDGFEGVRECPEHELTLVPIDRLPQFGEGAPDEVAFFGDPRLGRGGVLGGALLVIVGFLAPFARAPGVEASALEIAVDGASNLWLTPGAALGVLSVLWVRRGRQGMRAARMAVLGLALAGAFPLIYTSRRIGLVAEAYSAEVEWLWGFGAMVGGLALIAFASARLGGPGGLSGD